MGGAHRMKLSNLDFTLPAIFDIKLIVGKDQMHSIGGERLDLFAP